MRRPARAFSPLVSLRLRAAPSVELDAHEFLDVPNSYRMRMHWFIFGPAWSAEECERELQLMAAAHIGGVLIFPAYPIALDDPEHGIRNQPYLSPDFFEVLNAALKTCKRLGLTAEILVGTIGRGPIDTKVYERYGQRFLPGEEWEKVREPFSSGLMGPVRLVFYKIIHCGPGAGTRNRGPACVPPSSDSRRRYNSQYR